MRSPEAGTVPDTSAYRRPCAQHHTLGTCVRTACGRGGPARTLHGSHRGVSGHGRARLPEAAAVAAERSGTVDWRPLAVALDTLYVARGGTLGVRAFLTSPQRTLSGAVPAELIAHGGGLSKVAWAAYNESTRADLSRAG